MTTIISDDELFMDAGRAKGKVVVLTGTRANGIGKEVAMTFSKYGAIVVIGDLDVAGAEAVVSAITADGGKATTIKCNIANAGITEIERNVCMGELKVVDGRPVAPKLATLEVNLIAVFYSQYVLEVRASIAPETLTDRTGAASWQGVSRAPQYSASKHGVLGLMRALDASTAEDNIRIAVIHPWFADTTLLELPMRLLLAGIPLTPISRIAGAVFRAATDPDLRRKEGLRGGVYEMLSARIRRAKG
ncbi:hypothetical protein BJV77DRAFT_1020304 [Russula vinacea]|nr:hypothetical protein BJV77DRAFT_1020304 [Russula vinacea]